MFALMSVAFSLLCGRFLGIIFKVNPWLPSEKFKSNIPFYTKITLCFHMVFMFVELAFALFVWLNFHSLEAAILMASIAVPGLICSAIQLVMLARNP